MTGPRSKRVPSAFPVPPEVLGVHCPHCDGARVAVASLFGGSVSEMLLECHDCRSFFHWMKFASEENRDFHQ